MIHHCQCDGDCVFTKAVHCELSSNILCTKHQIKFWYITSFSPSLCVVQPLLLMHVCSPLSNLCTCARAYACVPLQINSAPQGGTPTDQASSLADKPAPHFSASVRISLSDFAEILHVRHTPPPSSSRLSIPEKTGQQVASQIVNIGDPSRHSSGMQLPCRHKLLQMHKLLQLIHDKAHRHIQSQSANIELLSRQLSNTLHPLIVSFFEIREDKFGTIILKFKRAT